jgi:hypothetical protein
LVSCKAVMIAAPGRAMSKPARHPTPSLAVEWFVGKPLDLMETGLDPWNGDIGLQGTPHDRRRYG